MSKLGGVMGFLFPSKSDTRAPQTLHRILIKGKHLLAEAPK